MSSCLRVMDIAWPYAVVVGVVLALAGCAKQDLTEVQQFVETTKRTAPPRKPDPPPEIKPYNPFTYTAQGLKDPFWISPFAQEEELAETLATGIQKGSCTGVRPDPNRVREELEKYSLGSLKMVGTFRMSGNKDLWALVLAPDGVVHRLQKDNYLGTNHGRIASITEQRVDLKEIVPEGQCWQARDAFLSLQ
ncbi:MAG: pilus assembly protein PilP [Candidatus Competibacteraceae bacterium]